MSTKYHILPSERKKLREETIKRATDRIGGPVGFYEEWPDETPKAVVAEDANEHRNPFCIAVWEDVSRRERCILDHELRAQELTQNPTSVCWLGVHNAVCHILDNNSSRVTLLGGAFHINEYKNEAFQKLEGNIKQLPSEQKEKLISLWNSIPDVSSDYVINVIGRELELAAKRYSLLIDEMSRFRYEEGNVSHDLLIFLQSLLANIEILSIELKRSQNIGKKWDGRFEEILDLCEIYSEIIRTRLGNLGEPVFDYQPYGRIIHGCIELHRPIADKRSIDVTVDLEKIKDDDGQIRVPHIRMAKDYLNRAFHNVLDNAIKYSFSGATGRRRWIEVIGNFKVIKSNPGYNIKISNYGIGIEEDELEMVFEPRYQGRLRKGELRPGSGMGLPFVKECIELHGGTITIESHRLKDGDAWLTILNIWLPIHGPKVLAEG